MRKLTKSELDNLKALTENQIPVTLIEPTKTGLGKSILDATAPVRAYLKDNQVHDYSQQAQGQNAKVLIPATLYSDFKSIKSRTSLYRPTTKGGDPRIWFSKLNQIARPNEIVAVLEFEGELHVFNISTLDIRKLIDSQILNPLQELFIEVRQEENEVADELLGKLKKISARGFIKSDVNADTGIGRTLETLLGIQMNSTKAPDYKGIELKSGRSKRNNRSQLFAKTPDWKLSKFKSRVEVLDNFGYWSKGIFRLYNTIRATGRNQQGLILKVKPKEDWLVENSDKKDIGDFLVWEFEVLRKALLKKHKETFWISAQSKVLNGNEHFHFKKAIHTKNPMADQLDVLITSGAITLDYPIKRLPNGKVEDKGCNFKLKANSLDLLFPPPATYDLTK